MAETKALWRREGFSWDGGDCILRVCDHIERVTGIDPAAPWRGTYHTEGEAVALYESYGGVLALFTHGMELAGFRQGPRAAGRPVICEVAGHQVAGLDFGGMIGFVHPNGMSELRIEPLAAWVI